jgi:hypothetical protein
MEDVLDAYTRPYDPRRPLICMDEVAKQLLREVRMSLPAAPGRAVRRAFAYERGGVVTVVRFCEPLQAK